MRHAISHQRHTAPEQVLKQLFWLRNIAIAGQLITILSIQYLFDIPLPAASMLLVTGSLLLFNAVTYWRLQQQFPVTGMEIMLHLAIDSCAFAVLLFFSGGSSNAFVSLLLVPVALAAVYLRLRSAVVIAILCIALYTFLMFWYVPLPPVNHRFGGDFNLHIFGMWANFILSTFVAVIFISTLAQLARKRDEALARVQEQILADEHLVSLGTLVAGAAHEFSTPLSNITMIADELLSNPDNASLVKEEAMMLKEQSELCRQQLNFLLRGSNEISEKNSEQLQLSRYLENLLDRWKAMRSDISVESRFNLKNNPFVTMNRSVSQALLNLLNNAADASLDNGLPRIAICCESNQEQLSITIDDYGRGLNEQQMKLAGKVAFSTKNEGMGIGLMLTHATLSRLGGTLTLYPLNRQLPDKTGIRARIKLPLERLS